MFGFIAPTKKPAVTQPVAINSFSDFYKLIDQFKVENPHLKFNFLSKENLDILQFNTDQYKISDVFVVPDDKKEVVKEVDAYKDIIKMNGTLGIENKGTARGVVDKMVVYNDLAGCKKFVSELNSDDKEINIFNRLYNLPQNKNFQREILAVEESWNKRKIYAFFPSEYLSRIAKKLQDLETYLAMINDELLQNSSYTVKAYAYAMGINEEKKNYLKELVNQTAELIKKERYKLCQAMISRLEVVPKGHMLAFIENRKLNDDPIYDDVICTTAHALEKYGLNKLRLRTLEKYARHTLNYDVINQFTQYIVNYGTDEHKRSFSALFNGQSYDDPIVPLEQQQASGSSPTPPTPPKSPVQKADALDVLLPLIKKDAFKYFNAQKFLLYDDLHAKFIRAALLMLENGALDKMDFNTLSKTAYEETLRTFIQNYANEVFPRQNQLETKNSFIQIANELASHLPDDKNFDKYVLEKAQRRLLKIQQTKLDLLVKMRAQTLKRAGMSDHCVGDFIEIARENIRSIPGWNYLNDNDLANEVDKTKEFMVRKETLISLLDQENQRINTKSLHNFFMRSSATLEKSRAIATARVKVDTIKNIADLYQESKSLLQNQSYIKKRSIFSFFEKQSTTKVHLQSYINSFRLRR